MHHLFTPQKFLRLISRLLRNKPLHKQFLFGEVQLKKSIHKKREFGDSNSMNSLVHADETQNDGASLAVQVDNLSFEPQTATETPSTAAPTSADPLLQSNIQTFPTDSNNGEIPVQPTGNDDFSKDSKQQTVVVDQAQGGNMGALEDAIVPKVNPSSYRFLFPFNLTFEFITPMVCCFNFYFCKSFRNLLL